MKNVWKWVIGIAVALIIIVSIICVHTVLAGRMVDFRNDIGTFQSFRTMPHMQFGDQFSQYYNHYGMMDGYNLAYPRAWFGISFLRGLVPFALLGLLLYGVYQLGTRKNGTPSNLKSEAIDVGEGQMKVNEVQAIQKTCSKCGGVLQEEWRNCPHCGKRQ